jgi:hypothetical protein
MSDLLSSDPNRRALGGVGNPWPGAPIGVVDSCRWRLATDFNPGYESSNNGSASGAVIQPDGKVLWPLAIATIILSSAGREGLGSP